MAINTKYTVQHFRYLGSTSVDGYPTVPTYEAVVPRKVYGWYPSSGHASVSASSMSNSGDYTRRVITSKVVLVPDTSFYSVLDKIVLPDSDTEFFISEDVRDYTTGPFTTSFGGGELIITKVSG